MNPYRLGNDMCLIHVENACIEGWERTRDLRRLTAFIEKPIGKVKEGLHWVGAKIPADLMKKVYATVHKFPHMETGFVMYYDSHNRKWFIKCPEQRGWGGHVSMNDDGKGIPPGGFSAIGTIHTHPGMGAFWSSGDTADQKGTYGVHMVFGLRDGIPREILVTIFTPEASYDIPKESILEDVDMEKVPEYEAPKDWVETIKKGVDGGVNHAMSFQRQDFTAPAREWGGTVRGGTFSYPYGGVDWSEYRFNYNWDNRQQPKVPRLSDEEAQARIAAWLARAKEEDERLAKEEAEWEEFCKRGKALLEEFHTKTGKVLGVTDRVLLAWACLDGLKIEDIELDQSAFENTREFLTVISEDATEAEQRLEEYQDELLEMAAEAIEPDIKEQGKC